MSRVIILVQLCVLKKYSKNDSVVLVHADIYIYIVLYDTI
jgi:hypothetical protein